MIAIIVQSHHGMFEANLPMAANSPPVAPPAPVLPPPKANGVGEPTPPPAPPPVVVPPKPIFSVPPAGAVEIGVVLAPLVMPGVVVGTGVCPEPVKGVWLGLGVRVGVFMKSPIGPPPPPPPVCCGVGVWVGVGDEEVPNDPSPPTDSGDAIEIAL